MKLKAARDRGQQLRAVLDPVVLSRLPDDARHPFEGIPDAATFLRRKVEKDIGDLAYLKSIGVSLPTVAETAARLAILEPLLNFTMQVPQQAYQGASRLLARHDIHIDPAPLISETKDALELARRDPVD